MSMFTCHGDEHDFQRQVNEQVARHHGSVPNMGSVVVLEKVHIAGV